MKINRIVSAFLVLCMLLGYTATYVSAEETIAADTQTQEAQSGSTVADEAGTADLQSDNEESDIVSQAVEEKKVEITVGEQIHFQDVTGQYTKFEETSSGIVNVSLQTSSFPAKDSAGGMLAPGIGYYIQNSRAASLPLLTSNIVLTDELALSGNLSNPPTNSVWYVEEINDGYALRQGNGYLEMLYNAQASTVDSPVELNLIYYADQYWRINKGTSLGLNDFGGGGDNAAAYTVCDDGGNAWKFFYAQDTDCTDITFTAVSVGNTRVQVGNTVYVITVIPRGGERELSLDYGEGTTVGVVLEDGETVEWTTTNSDIVFLYDTSGNQAEIIGRTAGEAVLTGTVRDSSGNVAAVYVWNVTVDEKQDSGRNTVTAVVSGLTTVYTKAYYSVNGGPLQEMPELEDGETLTVEYTGTAFGIYFFGVPEEGYALTHMGAGLGSTFDSLMDGTSGIHTSTFGAKLADHVTRGIMTESEASAMLAEVEALGAAGGCFYTRTYSDTINIGTLTFTAQSLPTVSKTISGITRNGEDVEYVPGMKVVLGDTIHYEITVTNTATDSTYGHVTFSSLILTDNLVELDSSQQPSQTTSETDWTHTTQVDVKLGLDNYAQCVVDGVVTNTATLECIFTSNYSNGSATSQSTAVAEIKVKSPYYVIDFGLPLDIELDADVVEDLTISDASANYGLVTYDGIELTYTPNTVLPDEDFITITLENDRGETYGYGVWIYPASSVYYEEGFISGWSGGSTGAGKQSALHEELDDQYGHDSVYESVLTGGSQKDSSAPGTNTASFEFTGTGVDIYANCSGATGSVLVMVENANTGYIAGLFQVDTAFKPGTTALTSFQEGSAYGLPIVSVNGLSHGNYKVTIYHVAGAEGNSSAVHLDGFRVYGTLQDQSVYAEDGEAAPMFIQLRDALLNTMNVAQVQAASRYAEDIAKGIFQQVLATGESLNGAVLLTNDTGITLDNDTLLDLLDNGPKNEIFLQPGYSLVFNVPSAFEVQVGLKAVNGQAAECTLNGNQVSVNSSVDMFYPVTLGEDGSVTITNNSGGILSITSLKLLGGAQPALGELTADSFVPLLLSAGYESRGSQSCTEHTWGEWTVTREASVGSQGCREHTCAVCGVTQEENFYMGDLDGDGMVSVVDAMLLRQLIAGWELADINLRATDINGDGRIDAADAMALRMMIANA